MYYDHHSICERLNVTPCKMESVVECLQSKGYKASRTHFSGTGIKTDAPLREVKEALMSAPFPQDS